MVDRPSFVQRISVAAKWNEAPLFLSGSENIAILQLHLKKVVMKLNFFGSCLTLRGIEWTARRFLGEQLNNVSINIVGVDGVKHSNTYKQYNETKNLCDAAQVVCMKKYWDKFTIVFRLNCNWKRLLVFWDYNQVITSMPYAPLYIEAYKEKDINIYNWTK